MKLPDPRGDAERALQRLMTANRPGRVSLAGAYALGYGALGLAQLQGESPEWFDQVDPLDALFLGTAWPSQFRDQYEFGNARTAWLRLMRETAYWQGIERFVAEVMEASEHYELPVDEGDLMLLLAGRLEDAGLDQRPLPSKVLPKTALAAARFVTGPPGDLHFLPAPPDAAERTGNFWASTEVGLAHDGTTLDALREGVHLLSQAGLPVHDDSLMLLVALYTALVTDDGGLLDDETGDRAHAWALGVPADSPLAPFVDVLLVAAERELPPDATIGHLLALDVLDRPVPAGDRRWRSAPGTELSDLAFELGFHRLNTRSVDLVSLPPAAVDAVQAQFRLFEEKFGRSAGPEDPIFFDPDNDEPVALSLVEAERSTIGMLQAAGIHPAWIYAAQNTGGLMPRPDGTFADAARAREWGDAVNRYLCTHPHHQDLDEDTELRKYRTFMAVLTVGGALDDPERGGSLARRLSTGRPDAEIEFLADLLEGMAPDLLGVPRRSWT